MSPSYQKQVSGPPHVCVACGARLADAEQIFSHEYLGSNYSFCSDVCLAQFIENPEKFMEDEDDDRE